MPFTRVAIASSDSHVSPAASPPAFIPTLSDLPLATHRVFWGVIPRRRVSTLISQAKQFCRIVPDQPKVQPPWYCIRSTSATLQNQPTPTTGQRNEQAVSVAAWLRDRRHPCCPSRPAGGPPTGRANITCLTQVPWTQHSFCEGAATRLPWEPPPGHVWLARAFGIRAYSYLKNIQFLGPAGRQKLPASLSYSIQTVWPRRPSRSSCLGRSAFWPRPPYVWFCQRRWWFCEFLLVEERLCR